MLKEGSLKHKLLNFLKDNKVMTRKEAYAWSKKNGYEQATFERRCRELVNEVGVVALNDEGKPARQSLSEHIVAWVWKPTTVFRHSMLSKSGEIDVIVTNSRK